MLNYDKKEIFLEKEKWVRDLCAEGKLDRAIERARESVLRESSYSNLYKAFDIIKYK